PDLLPLRLPAEGPRERHQPKPRGASERAHGPGAEGGETGASDPRGRAVRGHVRPGAAEAGPTTAAYLHHDTGEHRNHPEHPQVPRTLRQRRVGDPRRDPRGLLVEARIPPVDLPRTAAGAD